MSAQVFRATVIALLFANLALLAILLLRPTACPDSVADDAGVTEQLVAMAEGLQRAYNASDSAALYKAYGHEARSKLTQEKVAADMAALHEDFGIITAIRYLSRVELGKKGTQRYLQVHFAASLDNADLRGAQLVLHVIQEADTLELYGMRLHAAKNGR